MLQVHSLRDGHGTPILSPSRPQQGDVAENRCKAEKQRDPETGSSERWRNGRYRERESRERWRENPIWGTGLGTTGAAALRTNPESAFVTESQFLKALTEHGVFGLIVWAYLWFQIGFTSYSTYKTETDLIPFEEIDVDVIELTPETGSKITQKPLEEIDFPKDSIVGVINHHGNLSIARGASRITEEDTVLVFSKTKAIAKIRELFGLDE